MEEEEGPECGKADFVLLDQVTMEDFMENLKLRWAQDPDPSLSPRGGCGHRPPSGLPQGLGGQAGRPSRARVAQTPQTSASLTPTLSAPSCPAPNQHPDWWTPHHTQGPAEPWVLLGKQAS